MSLPINSYEIRSDGWVLFRVPRCLFVFTREELVRAIKRGKIWRRHGGERLTVKKDKDEVLEKESARGTGRGG